MIDFKIDFPIFQLRKDFYYLDSAATSQKPQVVIDALTTYYSTYNSPVHRSQYETAEHATNTYEGTRKKVAEFINAKSEHEIIFTKNTNESMNIIANNYAHLYLTKGDIVVLSKMEHHANIVPWLKIQKEIGFTIRWLDFDKDYNLLWEGMKDWPDKEKISIVSLTHASNVLGTINPIKEIISFIRKEIIHSVVCIVDGAQAIPHLPIDVQDLDCDFYVFSGHKILAPSGVGVLYGKTKHLFLGRPLIYGSHMISSVTEKDFKITDDESSFEAGTPNIEGVIGLGIAISYLQQTKITHQIQESTLTQYALFRLLKTKGLTLYGPPVSHNRLGIFSFNINGIHAHDVAEVLGRKGICVRAGHHCAMPLMDRLDISSCVRASLYLYNDEKDIDKLIEGIEEVKQFFKV